MFSYNIKKIPRILSSSLIRNGSVYTISTIIEKAIPFLLLPIITRYLSAEEYGIYAMFTVLIGLYVPLSSLMTQSAIFRSFYENKVDYADYISNSIIVLISSVLIISILTIINIDFISKISGIKNYWIYTLILIGIFQFLAYNRKI